MEESSNKKKIKLVIILLCVYSTSMHVVYSNISNVYSALHSSGGFVKTGHGLTIGIFFLTLKKSKHVCVTLK